MLKTTTNQNIGKTLQNICKGIHFVVKLQAEDLKLNKKELVHTDFQGYFPDFKNILMAPSAGALYFDCNVLV